MKKFALLLGATLFSLVLAEGVLRLTGLGVVRPQIQFGELTGNEIDSGLFVTDPDLFWREPAGPPDALHLGTHFVRIGDQPPAKSDKLRIMIVGDSCTRISTARRPYSLVLQESIEGRAEVFNASLPGYTSHQGLAWLRRQLLDFEPDLVVLYFGWNDHWRSWGVSDSDYARQLAPSSLRLAGLLRGLPDEAPFRLTPDEYHANLTAMTELVADAGGTTMIVLAPHHLTDEVIPRFLQGGNILRGDDPRALHLEYLAVARSVADRAGVRLYDAAAQFAAMNEPRLMLMRDGIHPTDPGHVVLARTLADDIMRHEFGVRFRPLDPAALGLAVLAQDATARGQWADAAELYRKALAVEPDEMGTRMGLAWVLATCPDDTVRNGNEAVALLEPGTESGATSARFLDVHAAALAEAGRFDEAVAEINRALALLESTGRSTDPYGRDLQARRDSYAAGNPFRMPAPGRR